MASHCAQLLHVTQDRPQGVRHVVVARQGVRHWSVTVAEAQDRHSENGSCESSHGATGESEPHDEVVALG